MLENPDPRGLQQTLNGFSEDKFPIVLHCSFNSFWKVFIIVSGKDFGFFKECLGGRGCQAPFRAAVGCQPEHFNLYILICD